MPCQLLNEHLLLPEHFCSMSHCHPDFKHPFHLFEAVTCHIGWTVGRNTTVILSKDILVDRSNSSPMRRHVWISPAECEPLWFFLVLSCDARELKVCDFEMDRGSRLLDHGVCKHQHTLWDVTQPRHREDIINELVSTASGQFIYAFHCAQVYDDQNGHPEELLDTFVGIHTLSCNHQQAFSPSS